VRGLYRSEVAEAVASTDPLAGIRGLLPPGFDGWPALERAAHLELTTLLGDHLLAAQGDRVAMAHGVEGRYPFLDHRVHAHATALPAHRKLDGLRDKIALRDAAGRVLPERIAGRRKQPYRAPEVVPFFEGEPPAWVAERLSPAALDEVGIFDPQRVDGLLRRCRAGRATGPRESMALVSVVSTQLWHEQLCTRRASDHPVETDAPKVRVDINALNTTMEGAL
jgi:asparagine synthase (glutamine-hydrolysing)